MPTVHKRDEARHGIKDGVGRANVYNEDAEDGGAALPLQ